jgi:hypothetical protein
MSLFVFVQSIFAQTDKLQVIDQIDAPGHHPWSIKYHDELFWVTDDSLNTVFKMSKTGNIVDSIYIADCSPRGLTFKNDSLWIINNKPVGDTVFYWDSDSSVIPFYNMYHIDKITGQKVDSIEFMGAYGSHTDFFDLEFYNSKFYLSFDGGWGPAMFEIDPLNESIIRLCCAHPCGLTVVGDTLWTIRQNSSEGPGNLICKIEFGWMEDSTSSTSDDISGGKRINFFASDISWDGNNFWALDTEENKIKKLKNFFTNIGTHNSFNNTYPKFKLSQNYPNPFNPSTIIQYNLQESGHVELKIFDLAGKEIETLVNGFQTAGKHQITWQPKGLSSGVYISRLQAGGSSQTKKLILD